MRRIYASETYTIIASDNGFMPFGENSLSVPVMVYFQLNPKEHIAMKFYLKLKKTSFKKMHMKMSTARMAAIV